MILTPDANKYVIKHLKWPDGGRSLYSFWMNLLFRLGTCGLQEYNSMNLSDHYIYVNPISFPHTDSVLQIQPFLIQCFHYVISHALDNQTQLLSNFQTHSNWTSHMGPSFHTTSFDPFPPRFATAHKHIPTHSLTHKHIQGHRVQSHPLPAIKATFVLTVASGLPGAWKRGSGRLYPLYPLFSLHLFSVKQQKEPAVELMLPWMVTTMEMTAAFWPQRANAVWPHYSYAREVIEKQFHHHTFIIRTNHFQSYANNH